MDVGFAAGLREDQNVNSNPLKSTKSLENKSMFINLRKWVINTYPRRIHRLTEGMEMISRPNSSGFCMILYLYI